MIVTRLVLINPKDERYRPLKKEYGLLKIDGIVVADLSKEQVRELKNLYGIEVRSPTSNGRIIRILNEYGYPYRRERTSKSI